MNEIAGMWMDGSGVIKSLSSRLISYHRVKRLLKEKKSRKRGEEVKKRKKKTNEGDGRRGGKTSREGGKTSREGWI